MKLFLKGCLYLLIGFGVYLVYLFNFAENVNKEILTGTYKGISIGDNKSQVIEKFEDFVRNVSYKKHRQLEFTENGDKQTIQFDFVKSNYPNINEDYYNNSSTWIIYICSSACDWSKSHHWVSLTFNSERLNRIYIYEKILPEVP